MDMNVWRSHPEIVAWLRHIATSPERASFAIITNNVREAHVDVLVPMREVAPAAAVRLSTSGPCTAFGRRVHLVTREQQLIGFAAYGLLLHSWPEDNTYRVARTRLVPGGRMFNGPGW